MSRPRRRPRPSSAPAPGAARSAPAADRPSAPTWWAHPALGAALVAVLLYLPSLGGDFLRDDHFLIERHPFLREPGMLGRLLLADFWAPVSGATGMWRPLVVLSYWVDGRLGGWAPFWFHAVNVGAHALATAALALVVLASGARAGAAWLAALLFASLPAHAECVAWISGRTDVFCALFGLLAVWLDQRAHRERRRWPGAPAVLSLALALASKEAGVPLVGVLVLLEWSRARAAGTSLGRSALWLTPYAAVTLLYLILHGLFAPDPGLIEAPELQGRAAARGIAWSLLPGYLAFLWPWFPHSPDRATPRLAADPGTETAIGAVAVAGLVAWLVALAWRRSRLAPPLALVLLPLVPPLVVASLRGYGLYGERHVFLSSAGVTWALALALPPLAARLPRAGRLALAGVAAVVIAGGIVGTLRALPAYRDDHAMYRTMTEREPGNPIGFVGLAAVLTERGDLGQALSLLARAERLDPGMTSVFVGRARVATRREAWPEALEESARALALDPRLQSARLLHAVALMRLRRLDEAGAELTALRAEYPGHPEVGTVWGQFLVATGRPAEALPVLEAAVRLLPGEPSLWDALGMAHVRLGRGEEARAAFRRAVTLAPDYLEGWMRLAAACQVLGDPRCRDEALSRARALPGGEARVSASPLPRGTGAP